MYLLLVLKYIFKVLYTNISNFQPVPEVYRAAILATI